MDFKGNWEDGNLLPLAEDKYDTYKFSFFKYAGTYGCSQTYRHIPIAICSSKIVAPDDGLKSPKHVEHLMINKDTL